MRLEPATIELLDTAEIILSTDVDLPASVDEVWAVIVENSSWTEWFDGCRSVTATPKTWEAAGNTRSIAVGALRLDEVAVEIRPRERWAMSITRSNLPLATSMLEILDITDTSRQGESRTQVSWTGAMDLPAYLRPARRLIEQGLSAKWGKSLEALLDSVTARR